MKYPSKTDIILAVKFPPLIKDSFFKGGIITMTAGGKPKCWAGGFSMVFQMNQHGELWAFKVWHTDLTNIKLRYTLIDEHLKKNTLPYFTEFAFVEKGLFVDDMYIDTYRMRWIDGMTLNDYLTTHVINPVKIYELASKFKEMVATFHKHSIAHGDLQHGNIIVSDEGDLMVIDYDSMFVKELGGMPDLIKGQAGYQHPSRHFNSDVNEKLDYFSELIIYTSLTVYAERPELWNPDTDWLLFSKEDLETPELCPLFMELKESANPLVSILIYTLREFLRCEDISQLVPLEQIISSKIPTTYPILESITNKF